MIELEFRQLASGCLEDIPFDATSMLHGVYRQRRRHQATAVARLGTGATAIVVALLLVVGGGSGQEFHPARLDPFVIASSSEAPTLAMVDGLALTYLPPDTAHTPVHTETYLVGRNQNFKEELICFIDDCHSGIGVTVSRRDGLSIHDYLSSHWVGVTTETTVNGIPALALNVRGDDAAGVMWSPSPGVVVEIHVGNHLRSELRPIVEGLRLGSTSRAG